MTTSSPTISNSTANNNLAGESKRKKRRKFEDHNQTEPLIINKLPKWRTNTEQQIYSSKLLEALRGNDHSSCTIRETADRVLAVTAKGRTRWSRAILTTRLSRKYKKLKLKSSSTIKSKKLVKKKMKLPALQRKVRVLSRLVPGCRKLPVQNLLEETSDYIAALEMQVRTMTFLTGILTGGGAGSLATNQP